MNRPVDLSVDLGDFANGLFGSLIQAVQLANAIPGGDDHAFYRMLNRSLASSLDSCGEGVLDLCNALLGYAGAQPHEQERRTPDGGQQDEVDDPAARGGGGAACLRRDRQSAPSS